MRAYRASVVVLIALLTLLLVLLSFFPTAQAQERQTYFLTDTLVDTSVSPYGPDFWGCGVTRDRAFSTTPGVLAILSTLQPCFFSPVVEGPLPGGELTLRVWLSTAFGSPSFVFTVFVVDGEDPFNTWEELPAFSFTVDENDLTPTLYVQALTINEVDFTTFFLVGYVSGSVNAELTYNGPAGQLGDSSLSTPQNIPGIVQLVTANIVIATISLILLIVLAVILVTILPEAFDNAITLAAFGVALGLVTIVMVLELIRILSVIG